MSHAKRKPSSNGVVARKTNDWGGWFVRCDLPKKHLSFLQTVPPDFDRMAEWEESMAERGYKLSITYKADKKSFVASATDQREDSPTYKGTLSAFAPTYWGAKLALQWKHEEALGGDWGLPEQPSPEWG